MQNNSAFKFAPAISHDTKLDVTVADGQTVIKLSTWHDDLGWCGQKTIALEAEMLDELHRVVAAARSKIKAETTQPAASTASNVLRFPATI